MNAGTDSSTAHLQRAMVLACPPRELWCLRGRFFTPPPPPGSQDAAAPRARVQMPMRQIHRLLYNTCVTSTNIRKYLSTFEDRSKNVIKRLDSHVVRAMARAEQVTKLYTKGKYDLLP